MALAAELRAYPGVDPGGRAGAHERGAQLFVPLVLAGTDGPRLTFFSTVATFGTALDITVAELSIEAFFPADADTAEVLRRRWPA